MKFFKPTALVLALLINAAACNRNSKAIDTSSSQQKNSESLAITLQQPETTEVHGEEREKYKYSQEDQVVDTAKIHAQGSSPQQQRSNSNVTVDWDKKIIRNAFINLEIKNTSRLLI
ncbi:MAG TPA: hypothetical protein VFP87_13090 [Chitinophagaceae bacterium]|nr:hypothetical protein [Chitinophagaceae bacterium]